MIIDVSKLNTDYCYNSRAENAIALSFCYHYDMVLNEQSYGLNSGYDVIINNKKVEIKVQTSGSPFIEYANYDMTPSGITLTNSDIYMILNPGMSMGVRYMKMRLFYTRELYRWVDNNVQNGAKDIAYKPDSMGPGSRGYKLPLGRGCPVSDLYVLGFAYEDGKIDTHTVESRTYDTYVNQELSAVLR